MFIYLKRQKKCFLFRAITRLMVSVLCLSLVFAPSAGYAQAVVPTILNLPVPGAMVLPTPAFMPAIIKGVNIHPEDPLKFDFIIDKGESYLEGKAFEQESTKLIKYFMAALTIPEDQMWVNLSPYEKNRIIPGTFGQTEMGRDLLAQDYLLKQLTASLMYPEDELGKEFWDRVYKKAYDQFGTTEIPMNTFNKIWIVPQEAKVYEHSKGAFIVKSHLKVMMEEDYLALASNIGSTRHGLGEAILEDMKVVSGVSAQVVKEVLIPEIEREVNEGETFANLRQIYHSVILATWYKQALKESLLGKVYVDQNKTKGIDIEDTQVNQKIYDQYVEAFKKGVYNYIKEDYDPATQETIPRKYFSGGAVLKTKISKEYHSSPALNDDLNNKNNRTEIVQAALNPVGLPEKQILSSPVKKLDREDKYSMRLPEGVHEYWQEMKGGWEATPKRYPEYDGMMVRQKTIIERVKRFVGEKTGNTSVSVVELCCGRGKLFSQLVDIPGVDHVAAVDINYDVLEGLRSRLDERDLKGVTVELIEGNLDDLGTQVRIPKADVIIMNDALMHFPQPEKVLDLVANKLNNGGLFISNAISREGLVPNHPITGKAWMAYQDFVFPWLQKMGLKRFAKFLAKKEALRIRQYVISRDELKTILQERFDIEELVTMEWGQHHFSVRKKTVEDNSLKSPETVNSFHSSPVKISDSKEYKEMKKYLTQVFDREKISGGAENVYGFIRRKARGQIGVDFDEDLADHIILELKNKIAAKKLVYQPDQRDRLKPILIKQSQQYFDLIKGFGTIKFDVNKDKHEDLVAREEEHEDMFNDSLQAIDTLGEMGEVEAIDELVKLAEQGLSAHRKAVGVAQKFIDLEHAEDEGEEEKAYKLFTETMSLYDGIRRWEQLQSMLIKVIAELGVKAGEGSAGYETANKFLRQLTLDHDASGEAFFIIRWQAAVRLSKFLDDTTIEALKAANKLPPPKESTFFKAQSVEAANEKALTLGFATGYSLLNIKRVQAEQQVRENPQGFNFEMDDIKFRFARLVGVLDALISEKTDQPTRVDILNRLSKAANERTLFASVFLLDALEEFIHSTNKNAEILVSPKQREMADDKETKFAALRAYIRIAEVVQARLKGINLPLHRELDEDLQKLRNEINEGKIDKKHFNKTVRNVHIILENLGQLGEIKSFKERWKLLKLVYKIVVGSGSGAAAAMTGSINRFTTDPPAVMIDVMDDGGANLLNRGFDVVEMGIFALGASDHTLLINKGAILERVPGAPAAFKLLATRFGDEAVVKDEQLTKQGVVDEQERLAIRENYLNSDGTVVHGFDGFSNDFRERTFSERVPDFVDGIEKILFNAYKQGKLSYQMDKLYDSILETAHDSGPEHKTAFEKFFPKVLKIAKVIDRLGLSTRYNSTKSMILEGIMHKKEGYGKEFMNPDGIYAAFEEYRQLLGAKSIALPGTTIANMFMSEALNGEIKIGQSPFSHAPRGLSRGRQRSVLELYRSGAYFQDVALKNRSKDLIQKAKLIIFGLGSWGTSLAVLLRNKSLVKALMQNKGDKIIVTNAVNDDETRGMSWWKSTVTFLSRMMDMPVTDVFKKILTNANVNLDRLILPARPEYGTLEEVVNGERGSMYAGVNTPTKEDADKLKEQGVVLSTDHSMETLEIVPHRTNPEKNMTRFIFDPDDFAGGIYDLLSAETLEALTVRKDIKLIRRINDVNQLLKQRGLTLANLGIQHPVELIFYPKLVDELSEWIEDPQKVPVWVGGKDKFERESQYIMRQAIARAVGDEHLDLGRLRIGEVVSLGKIHGMNMRMKILTEKQSQKQFNVDRVKAKKDSEELQREFVNRLGIVADENAETCCTIVLPNGLLEMGISIEEKIERLRVVIAFQIERARRIKHRGTGHLMEVHEATMETMGKDKKILGELSQSVLYLRELRKAIREGKIMNFQTDMDRTVTPAADAFTPSMAYDGMVYFNSPGIWKTVITGQNYEATGRQIIEKANEIKQRMKLAAKLTGQKLPEGFLEGSKWKNTAMAPSSGGAVYLWDDEQKGFIKKHQVSIDPLDMLFIKLASYFTMADFGEAVKGHQFERRESETLPDGSKRFAAAAAIPPGREADSARTKDLAGEKRAIQGEAMKIVLKDPKKLLDRVKEYQHSPDDSPLEGITIEFGEQKKLDFEIKEGPRKEIIKTTAEILELLGERGMRQEDIKSITISVQVGGKTTIDISLAGKGERIHVIVDTISAHENLPPGKMVTYVIGDEMSIKERTHAILGKLPIEGNDFSVAQQVKDVGDSQLNMIKGLSHVGETGKGVTTLSNTSTSYNPDGVIPDDTIHSLAYVTRAVYRGSHYDYIQEKSTSIQNALTGHGESLLSFGVETFEELNERQAMELLQFLDIQVASSPIDGVEIKKEKLDTGSSLIRKGGIDLNPNEIDMQLEKEEGVGLKVPVVTPQQIEYFRNVQGFIPIIINTAPVVNLPLLLGLDGGNSENKPFNSAEIEEYRKKFTRRDQDELEVQAQLQLLIAMQ